MRLSDETRADSTSGSAQKQAEGGEPIRLYVKGTIVGYRRYVFIKISSRASSLAKYSLSWYFSPIYGWIVLLIWSWAWLWCEHWYIWFVLVFRARSSLSVENARSTTASCSRDKKSKNKFLTLTPHNHDNRGGANSGNHYNHTSLVNIEGLKSRSDVDWYLGKKIAYIFKAKTKKKNSNFRVIWGKVCAPHGSKGVVRAKFRKNLPPNALGAPVRVMLYPSRV